MEDSLKNIEQFFDINLEIKNLMINCAPTESDNYNTDSRIKYGDKLYFAIEKRYKRFIFKYNKRFKSKLFKRRYFKNI